jgi:hypothetical protein
LPDVCGAGDVTGTVAFEDGPEGIGFVHRSKAKAAFTISQLALGTHTVTAWYWENSFLNLDILIANANGWGEALRPFFYVSGFSE